MQNNLWNTIWGANANPDCEKAPGVLTVSTDSEIA